MEHPLKGVHLRDQVPAVQVSLKATLEALGC